MENKIARIEEIYKRGIQDRLPPEKRQIAEELIKRGVVKVPAQQPQQQEQVEPEQERTPFVGGLVGGDIKGVKKELKQVEALGRGALRGATLGMEKRITPYIAAAYAKGRGVDKPYLDLVEESKQVEATREQELRKIGKEYATGEAVGAMTSPANIPFGAIASKIGGAKGLIAAGALEGALVGAGVSEKEGKLARDVATSAALGGIFGATVPIVTKTVKGAGRIIFSKLLPKQESARVIQNFIDVKEIPQLKKALSEAIEEGKETILPDIGGSKLQGLMRSVGKTKAGSKIIEDALEQRALGSSERVIKSLSENISNVDNYFGTLDEFAKQRAILAKPHYEKAYKKIVPENKIKEFIDDDLIKKAYNDSIKDKILPKDIKINSIQALDAVKKKLDDYIGTAIRQGEREKVRSLTKFKNNLIDKIDNKNYKEARRISGDYFKLQDAMEEGRKIMKKTPEQLTRFFNELTDAEKGAARIGVREALQNKVLATASDRNAALKIFKTSGMKQKLSKVIPTEPQRNKFVKDMMDEFDFMKTKYKVLGGSRTDINIANDAEVLGSVVTGFRRGNWKGALSSVADITLGSLNRMYRGIDNEVAKELTDVLLNPNASIDMLENIIKNQKGVQKELTKQVALDIVPLILSTEALIRSEQEVQ
jgi:hypothetical protein